MSLSFLLQDWYPTARNNNKVRYENLPPGAYILKLRGGLVPESVSQNERAITVIVKPYWYQTLWSKILLGLLILGIGLIILQFKLKQERTKQESTRLQELDNIKTKLYTNITHEFRTPLTVIMGMNENINGHPHERSLIQRNAENLLALINQLLDLSKLDSGNITVDMIHGDIIEYLQYLTESFYSMASQKKINLRFDAALESLEMDYHEIKVQHVIYNLLSNAIKFTKTGGKINVHVQKETSHLKIEVKDTGEGITNEDLPHIFERFYQAGVKAKIDQGIQSYSGTGIGLALTKELVEIMEGSISVKSELGWGTTFTVLLPVKNEKASIQTVVSSENNMDLVFEESTITEEQPAQDKPLLLVVEDNPGIVSYIRSIVKETYDFHIAVNG
ncbi:MAG: sensor histidine kinase [Kordia sp.]|uniref:sensor histidine kinase n=1 Tax=Kordia sp. TaxID=1965332 RepID=UPI00385E611F